MPFLPARWLPRARFDTERIAPGLDLPTLVIHGTDDEVIPVRVGQRIAALVPHAEFVAVEAGQHNDLFDLHGQHCSNAFSDFARAGR